MSKPETIMIDDVKYVRADSVQRQAKERDGMKYCIIRTRDSGVFAAYVSERDGTEATLIDSRRLWYWDGAASLSELSQCGTSKPSNCKFPCVIPEMIVTGILEIIPCSEKAKKSIDSVKVWESK